MRGAATTATRPVKRRPRSSRRDATIRVARPARASRDIALSTLRLTPCPCHVAQSRVRVRRGSILVQAGALHAQATTTVQATHTGRTHARFAMRITTGRPCARPRQTLCVPAVRRGAFQAWNTRKRACAWRAFALWTQHARLARLEKRRSPAQPRAQTVLMACIPSAQNYARHARRGRIVP